MKKTTAKKALLWVSTALSVLLFSWGCEQRDGFHPASESRISINLVSDRFEVRGGRIGPNPNDHVIHTLDFLIFRKSDDYDDGTLDTYLHLERTQIDDLSDIELKSTSGEKEIFVIANCREPDLFEKIRHMEDFRRCTCSLKREDYSGWLMTGHKTATFGLNTRVHIRLERMVAQIVLESIRTDFKGTPYEGEKLENVRIYLTNVVGNKLLGSGLSPGEGKREILNRKALTPADMENLKESSFLLHLPGVPIGDGGYRKEHRFYCYGNTEGEEEEYTRLVIQGDLKGDRVYYPINVNRKGFGENCSEGHCGIRRNHTYSLTLTILRPGSTDPEDVIHFGALQLNITAEDWTVLPDRNITL